MKKGGLGSTRNTIIIQATPESLYKAFTSQEALEVWLAPGDMTGKVHSFDLRVGGGYEMSLFYPASENEDRGKTSGKEDRFTARFTVLEPFRRIAQAINFDSPDPAFSGEMIMEVTFEPQEKGTEVGMVFSDIPSGVRPEDNETGTQLSLEKLARYVS